MRYRERMRTAAGLAGRGGRRATHGRWPLVAAGLAPPATAAALVGGRWLRGDGRWVYWLPGLALLWHQAEEWVWPGGFLPWINRTVLGGGADEWPLTRRAGFGINVGLGWGLALLAALGGPRLPLPAAVNTGFLLGNVALHLGAAAAQRRYNPGLVTATALFVPLALAGGRAARAAGPAPLLGLGGGAVASLAGFVGLRRRATTGRPPRPPAP
jgi:hypothetical protein